MDGREFALLRFAANLSTMFQDLPLPERFPAAASAGFRAVEMQFPYMMPAAGMARALAANDLKMVLFNLPAGDLARGDLGLATLADRIDEFRAGVKTAVDYARALNCPRLNVIAGKIPADGTWRALLVDNLRFAADALGAAGLRLLIEPLNGRDHPGYAVTRLADAAALIDEAGRSNIGLQFDLYHSHIMESGNLAALAEFFPRIFHAQFSDHPGRGEPGSGDLDFTAFFARLRDLDYRGWIGCEYRAGMAGSLDWARDAAPELRNPVR